MNSLEIIKRESRIGANIYYTGYVLNPDYDYDTINPLYLVINRLIGYIEEIEGSRDKYLVVASCVIEKDNEYYPEIYLDECLYVKGNVWPTTI